MLSSRVVRALRYDPMARHQAWVNGLSPASALLLLLLLSSLLLLLGAACGCRGVGWAGVDGLAARELEEGGGGGGGAGGGVGGGCGLLPGTAMPSAWQVSCSSCSSSRVSL